MRMGYLLNGDRMINIPLHETLSWFAETSKEILMLLDPTRKIKYINNSFEKALRYDFSEIEDMNFIELVHVEDRNKTNELLTAFRNNQFYPPFTNRYRRKDGTYSTLLWHSGKLTKEGWFQLIGRLIESKPYNLEAKIENTVGLSNFFDMTDAAGDICDLEGRVILLNPAFENLYGWKTQEIVGKPLPIIPEDLQHEFLNLKSEIMNGKRIVHHQTFRMKKDGTLIPVSIIAAPIINENGDIIALSAITKDLSELIDTKMMVEKQNEMIAERDRLLIDISDNISEAICLFDMLQCKFLYVNPSFERLWGIGAQDLYEDPSLMEEKLFPKNLEKIRKYFVSPFHTPVELEFRKKDDTRTEDRWFRTRITPIADRTGEIIRNITITQDITDWKRQDEMLKKQDRLGVLGQLAAGIAHEIRNPLTTIKGFTQLRAQESNDINDKIIINELDRIESIVTEFLMLANPHQEIKFIHKNINEVLTEVIHFMQPEALLHDVEINTMLHDRLPLVSCESTQIKQVMINIIKNAIEAMPFGGKIDIGTSLLGDGSVAIEIKDEGSGIPKEMLDRLGEPFYSNKKRGTGLGLMVSYKIIENHLGTIEFDSENDNGTIVRVILPLNNNKEA